MKKSMDKRKKLAYAERKENARQEALAWQRDYDQHDYSWGELAEFSDRFTKLGKRYGLLREFHENGII